MRSPISAAVIAFLSCADVSSGYVPTYRDALAQQQQRRQSVTKPLQGYAFLYFTGNTVAGENIYLAASKGNDALQWSELNSGKPILKSSFGTKGLRDPFILRSQDGKKFYLLATDLSIGSGTQWGDSIKNGSRYLEIWESTDLITWSAQRHTLVSPAAAGNTWAPEAYWDAALNTYVVFWASDLYAKTDTNHSGSSYQRRLISKTSDFVTFSEPEIWQDAGTARIDSTVLEDNGMYYRFTKDEGAVTGCADIIQESSSVLQATLSSWKTIASCIGKNAGTSAVEGPTSFKANAGDVNGQNFYLFLDEYNSRGYIPLETASIANPEWKVSNSFSLPASPRHGTVIPVTAAELAAIRAHYGVVSAVTERTALSKRSSPVLTGLYADPNIAVFGKTYYIYATTDGYPGWGGNVFYVWSSTDLVSWTRSTEPFLTLNGTSGNVPWAIGNAWAPTITEKDGRYYFYFSGHNPTYDRKTIGLTFSSSPSGPFIAEPEAMIINGGNETLKSGQAIDPCAFLDPVSGKHFFLWGNGAALMGEMAEDLKSLKGSTVRDITSNLTDFREGLFVVYRKGLYHLTYSIDDTGSVNYRVGYATSKSVWGPWTNRGVVLQKREDLGIEATGHNSMIRVPGTDNWYMAYHRFRIPDGNGTNRETTIDKVEWDAETGLMLEVVPTLDSVQAETIVV
ncbi:Arabinanase/levansucrase/invertase [Glarea lozoyensis ATCC 20868]|uniref:Endo-1,5-alpha-L-arabinanase A n=1 Tax=Glarea lozoyensis (strain ATCC 20868 / MF5171) TaxID=1116229 RepID=S3CV07_GLAL2|nr:Arabinanase/levansucrase/invertase [Glarea lozoyensis ATCC 20868]EPE30232.1 Arabinanase/levansucrase/invertase [Glarea lozoyensis ATCC 20868]